MRLLNVFIFILLLFSTSCLNNDFEPTKTLSQDTMANIITDMHLGDAILISPSIIQKPFKINSEKFYSAILKKHNITKNIFEENITYYSSDTAKFKKIYENVVKNLNILQDNLMKPDSVTKK